MEGSRVVLVMGEEVYGQALARALGDLYPQLSLRTAREFPLPEEPLDLLVTDIPLDGCRFPCEKTVVLSAFPADPRAEAVWPCRLHRHMGVRRLGAELLFLCQGPSGLPFAVLASQTKAAGFIGGKGKDFCGILHCGRACFFSQKKGSVP